MIDRTEYVVYLDHGTSGDAWTFRRLDDALTEYGNLIHQVVEPAYEKCQALLTILQGEAPQEVDDYLLEKAEELKEKLEGWPPKVDRGFNHVWLDELWNDAQRDRTRITVLAGEYVGIDTPDGYDPYAGVLLYKIEPLKEGEEPEVLLAEEIGNL